MSRRSVLLTVALGCFVAALESWAQQPNQVRLVGRLAISSHLDDSVNKALRQGLRELGYIEGRDFRIEHRSADGHIERLPALAEELVRLKVDVIVTGTDEATRAAKGVTTAIPIVAVLYDHDPVAAGFINSFSRPGGNITGLTVRNTELAGKRLDPAIDIVAC